MEEEKKETKIKQPKKVVKIISIIIAIIAVIAIVIGILVATGKINLNFSKKSKMVSGIEKLSEAYTRPFDELSKNAEKNNLDIKLFDNLEKDSAIEASTEILANVDKLEVEEAKTKVMAKALTDLKVEGKTLIILADRNDNVLRSSRNIEGVKTIELNTINVFDLLNCNKLVLPLDTVKKLEEVYA